MSFHRIDGVKSSFIYRIFLILYFYFYSKNSDLAHVDKLELLKN
ncbi:hypothetical protein LEP1GSC066_1117 [Leptospira sp. serovar Kenya str. Sh9]|nr:hypothetical protein LEP1GSC066_1117 [Leptospira sp. serovar Kenya str. Sh9]